MHQTCEARRIVARVDAVLDLQLTDDGAVPDDSDPEDFTQTAAVQAMPPLIASSFGSARQAERVPDQTKTTQRRSGSSWRGFNASTVLPKSSERRSASGALGSQITPRSSATTCSVMRVTVVPESPAHAAVSAERPMGGPDEAALLRVAKSEAGASGVWPRPGTFAV